MRQVPIIAPLADPAAEADAAVEIEPLGTFDTTRPDAAFFIGRHPSRDASPDAKIFGSTFLRQSRTVLRIGARVLPIERDLIP